MKAILEHLPRASTESFVAMNFDYSYFPTPWHYHPEYELVLVTESTGKRFIGDDIREFGPGDLALIGPNLPHLYRNDPQYYAEGARLRASSIVVHFLPSSFGEGFIDLPEAAPILKLLQRSHLGIDVKGSANRLTRTMLGELVELTGMPRWLKLVEILQLLAGTEEYAAISRQPVKGLHENDGHRLNGVINMVMQSYHGDIRLEDAANLAGMTPPSFSRYFRQRTRKTFTNFVREIRLTHASKLLQEDLMSVTEVCFACGFNNVSNFNRQFRETYRMSPLAFRKQYRSTGTGTITTAGR